ncbi:uncharacterized protein LOC123648191 [Lemur catta]|uniref:uncharacterized protein LOC123648191 n=1 Tax=Lemur catta TaxID=9447 RepID=UPI001E267D92|nr:uncharacterized protein LOC123648191 [Lemur catta]
MSDASSWGQRAGRRVRVSWTQGLGEKGGEEGRWDPGAGAGASGSASCSLVRQLPLPNSSRAQSFSEAAAPRRGGSAQVCPRSRARGGAALAPSAGLHVPRSQPPPSASVGSRPEPEWRSARAALASGAWRRDSLAPRPQPRTSSLPTHPALDPQPETSLTLLENSELLLNALILKAVETQKPERIFARARVSAPQQARAARTGLRFCPARFFRECCWVSECLACHATSKMNPPGRKVWGGAGGVTHWKETLSLQPRRRAWCRETWERGSQEQLVLVGLKPGEGARGRLQWSLHSAKRSADPLSGCVPGGLPPSPCWLPKASIQSYIWWHDCSWTLARLLDFRCPGLP